MMMMMNSVLLSLLLPLAARAGRCCPSDELAALSCEATSPPVCCDGVWQCSGVCYDTKCDDDVGTCDPEPLDCPDGSHVHRDPTNDCEYPECGTCCPAEDEPGKFNNPFCTEGHACCPDGNWSCSIGDGRTFPCGGEQFTSGFGMACTPTIGRPAPPQICLQDVKECPDGSFVSRDPFNDCKFPPCLTTGLDCCVPSAKPECDNGNGAVCCFGGAWSCADACALGIVCDGEEPDPGLCPADVRECADGSFVTRDPANDCEFDQCCCDPAMKPGSGIIPSCSGDVQCCSNGFWTCQRNGDFVCDGQAVTSGFSEACDTTDPDDPGDACDTDVKQCGGDSYVTRDPNNGCEFFPCPTDPVAACCDPALEPATGDNRICFEGHACCPDGTWSCSIGDGKSFPCGGTIITGGFGRRCGADPVACLTDTKECDDGTFVSRDPNNNCKFRPCVTSNGCTDDAMQCPNGSYVSRDPNNNCEFEPCCCEPEKKPGFGDNPICADGVKCCANGYWSCGRGDGTFPCGTELVSTGFSEACEAKGCPEDEKQCDDGSYVNRDPNNNCEFFPCPAKPVTACCDPALEPATGDNNICFEGHACCPDGTWSCSIGDGKSFPCGGKIITEGFGERCSSKDPVTCEDDVKVCDDGSLVSRDSTNDCKFAECPTSAGVCATDVRECPDGSFVSRDPANQCKFSACKIATCTEEAKTCPDGSVVVRVGDKCEFEPCCCDPKQKPGFGGNTICADGARCCPDGFWSCGTGDGTFSCDADVFSSDFDGFGKECSAAQVVDPEDVSGCDDDTKACGDGNYVTRDPSNNCEFFPCLEAEYEGDCCVAESKPECGNAVCCSEGRWGCGDDCLPGNVCKIKSEEEEEEEEEEGSRGNTTTDAAVVTQCCEPTEKPDDCVSGGASCCGNGDWTCDAVDGSTSCESTGEVCLVSPAQISAVNEEASTSSARGWLLELAFAASLVLYALC